jgi:hypothetical protein
VPAAPRAMRPSAGAQFDLRQRVMAVLRLGHAVARHVTGKEIWKSLIECVDRMRSAFGSLELRIPGRVCFPLVLQLDAVAGELDGTMSCSIRPDLALRPLVGLRDVSQRLAQGVLQRGGSLDRGYERNRRALTYERSSAPRVLRSSAIGSSILARAAAWQIVRRIGLPGSGISSAD